MQLNCLHLFFIECVYAHRDERATQQALRSDGNDQTQLAPLFAPVLSEASGLPLSARRDS